MGNNDPGEKVEVTGKIKKNLFFKTLTEIIGRALSFLFYIVLARWIGAGDFGLFSLLYSITAIVVFLVDPGLNISLIRLSPRKPGYLAHAAGPTLTLKLIFTFVTIFVSAIYGYKAGYDIRMITLFALMGAQMSAFALMEFALAIFQAREEMQYETYIIGVGKTGVTAVSIAVLLLGGQIELTLIAMTLAQVGVAIWALRFASRKGAPLAFKWGPLLWLELLKGALPLGIITFFTIAFYRVDVALAPFLGISLENIGFYSAGVKIVDALLALPYIAMAALFPTLSGMAQRDRKQFGKWITGVIATLALGGALTGALTAWFAPDIIFLVFGSSFKPSAHVLMWLGITVAFIFVRHGFAQALILDGRHKIALALTGFALPLNIALNLWLAPLSGITGMAIAKLVTDMALVAGMGSAWYIFHGRVKGGPRVTI